MTIIPRRFSKAISEHVKERCWGDIAPNLDSCEDNMLLAGDTNNDRALLDRLLCIFYLEYSALR